MTLALGVKTDEVPVDAGNGHDSRNCQRLRTDYYINSIHTLFVHH